MYSGLLRCLGENSSAESEQKQNNGLRKAVKIRSADGERNNNSLFIKNVFKKCCVMSD